MSRPLAGPRLRRVLALVPWIAAHPGVTLDELASRFDVSRQEVERDLALLPFCGLPPYTPDRLIDVEIVGEQVRVRFADYFARPLRFTPAEGLSLLAAGQALLAVPGSDPGGPLAGALAKLARVLGVEGGVTVEVGGGPHLSALRAATERGERVEIDYYSFGRDALTTRQVDPVAVFHAFGQWYVAAFCHQAGEERLFRVDRVRAVRPTGERVTEGSHLADEFVTAAVYRPRPGDPRVTLRLGPSAGWVPESYPVEEAVEEGDGWRVVLAVSEQAWLERLLLRLGPEAEVLEPPELRSLGPEAARRLLRRYAP